MSKGLCWAKKYFCVGGTLADPNPPDPPVPMSLNTVYFDSFVDTAIEITPIGYPVFQWSFGAGAWSSFVNGTMLMPGGEICSVAVTTSINATTGWVLMPQGVDLTGWTYIDLGNPQAPQQLPFGAQEVTPVMECYQAVEAAPFDMSLYSAIYFTASLGANQSIQFGSAPWPPITDAGFESTFDQYIKEAFGIQASVSVTVGGGGDTVTFIVNNVYDFNIPVTSFPYISLSDGGGDSKSTILSQISCP